MVPEKDYGEGAGMNKDEIKRWWEEAISHIDLHEELCKLNLESRIKGRVAGQRVKLDKESKDDYDASMANALVKMMIRKVILSLVVFVGFCLSIGSGAYVGLGMMVATIVMVAWQWGEHKRLGGSERSYMLCWAIDALTWPDAMWTHILRSQRMAARKLAMAQKGME